MDEQQSNVSKKKTGGLKKLRLIIIAIAIIAFIINHFSGSNTPSKEEIAKMSNDDIKAKITDILKDELDDNLISVVINDNAGKNDGSKIVLVHAKGIYGYSDIPGTILTQDYTIFKLLYTSPYPISEAVVFSEDKLVDKLGNESLATVMKTKLSVDAAKKIDWKNSYVDLKDLLTDVWVSPAIKSKK